MEEFKVSAEKLYKNYHLSAKKSVEEKETLKEQNKRYQQLIADIEGYADRCIQLDVEMNPYFVKGDIEVLEG